MTRARTKKYSRSTLTLFLGIVGLLALYPLTGCASGGSTSGTHPSKLTAGTATPTNNQAQQTSPWKLVWDSEFTGPAGAPPDPTKWSATVGGEGWGNKQLDYD